MKAIKLSLWQYMDVEESERFLINEVFEGKITFRQHMDDGSRQLIQYEAKEYSDENLHFVVDILFAKVKVRR